MVTSYFPPGKFKIRPKNAGFVDIHQNKKYKMDPLDEAIQINHFASKIEFS